MEFTSPEGERRYAAVVRVADRAVVGLDFDGTLSPIVDDPERAHIHPEAPDVLVRLAQRVAAVAVVTGRPARQVLALGGLDQVGDRLGESGLELRIFGQYGNERWTSHSRRVVSPRPPAGLASFLADLPGLLRKADAETAYVEDKGLAVAVHTRRLDDAVEAFERLRPLLAEAAGRHHLVIEPGRQVVEVRAPGSDKGQVVEELADDLGARGFVFVGDDLGDLEAFEAVRRLGERGLATLLVCSASDEESSLRDLADVVVPGPEGVMRLLGEMADDIDRGR